MGVYCCQDEGEKNGRKSIAEERRQESVETK